MRFAQLVRLDERSQQDMEWIEAMMRRQVEQQGHRLADPANVGVQVLTDRNAEPGDIPLCRVVVDIEEQP